jgi:pimeloyl-ACP methyl ester carboxylesterase
MFKYFRKILNYLRPIQPLNVAYDRGGKRRPVIILLHGVAATSRTWDPLINILDMKKFRVIAIDLLGFGESPKPIDCEYAVEDHIRYLRKTIKKLKIRKPYRIVGHSMGSIIAARYCRYYPDGIKEVYLLSLPLYFKNIELHNALSIRHTNLYLGLYESLANKKNFTINVSKYLRKMLKIGDGIDVNEANWNSFRLSLKNTIINQDTYDDISNLSIPVNVIYGDLDQFIVKSNISKLSIFENVKITKISLVDHSISPRYAQKLARMLN